MNRLATITALVLITSFANAQTVYKFVDKSGNLVYSDTPVEGAETIEIQRPIIVPSVPPQNAPANEDNDSASAGYSQLSITSPSHDAVFSNDTTPLVVTMALTPSLKSGHKFRLLVNGTAMGGTQTSGSFTLPSLDRGSYMLVGQVVDRNMHAVTESAAVQIHVRRHSALFKKSVTR